MNETTETQTWYVIEYSPVGKGWYETPNYADTLERAREEMVACRMNDSESLNIYRIVRKTLTSEVVK